MKPYQKRLNSYIQRMVAEKTGSTLLQNSKIQGRLDRYDGELLAVFGHLLLQ